MNVLFIRLVFFALAVTCGLASADERFQDEITIHVDSEVLARHSGHVITFADFDAFMERIPEEDRMGVLRDPDRIGRVLQELALSRALGRAAIEDGLLEDERMRALVYHAIMNILAGEQRSRAVAAQELDDYTQQARERYLRDPAEYRQRERFDFTHLLIRAGEDDEAEALEHIEALADRLNAGESLEDLIRDHSDDPTAGENLGRITDAVPERLDPDFLRALRELEDGEISGPVRSRFGWHLVRLDRHQKGRVPEFEEIADRLRRQARNRHREQINDRYLASLLDGEPEIVPGGIEKLIQRYRQNEQ